MSNNSGIESHDCIKSWDDELIKVNNALSVKEAETNRSKKKYDNATVWEKTLETYWENIEETNRLGVVVKDEIIRFQNYLAGETPDQGAKIFGVGDFTSCTVEVTKALYCLVEDFYQTTDELKGKLSAIIIRIDCLNNPAINPKSSKIYACLKELAAKLDAAIASQKEAIQLVLDLVKSANILHYTLCSPEDGLDDKLKGLLNLFKTDTSQNQSQSKIGYGMGCETLTKTCNDVIAPAPVMPLACGDASSYFKRIKKLAEDAKEETDTAKDEYEGFRKARDILRSSKKSLENAKQASETAKACK